MSEPTTLSRREVEDIVRRYLAGVAGRYLPFGLAALLFAVVLVAVPSKSPATQNASGQSSAGGSSASGAGGTGSSGTGTGAAVGVGGAPPGAGGGVSSSAGGGATSAAGGAPVTIAPVGARGTTVSGVSCRPGRRQVTWTKYSTLCVPAFHGNNGGATAPGVTGNTITVSFRISDSGEASAVAAAAPSLNAKAQDLYYQDLKTYMSFFGKQFELYGRHVVLKEFTGKGDWVQEYQDQDLQAAQADADTAKSLGAFADISTTDVSTTEPYAQYLAQNHVLSVGGVAGSQQFFEQHAPYVYTQGPSVSNFADWAPGVICQRMKGLPAIFAGDTVLQHTKRVFGLIYPTNPDWQAVGRQVASRLQQCGAKIGNTYEYSINLSTMAQDSASAMAQMRAKGVTTVVCLCDTVVPRFLTNAADGQNYHPEWVSTGPADSLSENYAKDQWSHAIGASGRFIAETSSEAYHVYRLANPGHAPASIYYYFAYVSALLFYDALQNAGPDLTPTSFEHGFFNLASSLPGAQLGPWAFGTNHFSSQSGDPIGWYSTTTTSNETGAAGAWVNCSGSDGEYHPWEPQSGYGPAGTQLHCFGK